MTTPAGWYDDGSGRQRWWDGQQWTEHFAPETAAEPAAETAATDAGVPAESVEPAASELPDSLDDTVIRVTTPPAAAEVPATEAPQAEVPQTEIPQAEIAGSQIAGSQGETAPEAPIADAALPSYAAPTAEPVESAPSYGEVPVEPAAPAYPATPSFTDASPAYPGAAPSHPGAAPAYPGAAPAYPAASPAYPDANAAYPAAYPAAAADAPKKLSVLGLIGLGLVVVGIILSCIPALPVMIVGWILLPVGFILSIVSLFLKGTKWPGFVGLGLGFVGFIIAIIVAFVYFTFAVASHISDGIDDFPSAFPSDIATEPVPDDTEGTADADVDAGGRPSVDEVATGLTDVFATLGQDGGEFTPEVIECIAGEFVANTEITDEALQALAAGSDVAMQDVDAMLAFSEHLTPATITCLGG